MAQWTAEEGAHVDGNNISFDGTAGGSTASHWWDDRLENNFLRVEMEVYFQPSDACDAADATNLSISLAGSAHITDFGVTLNPNPGGGVSGEYSTASGDSALTINASGGEPCSIARDTHYLVTMSVDDDRMKFRLHNLDDSMDPRTVCDGVELFGDGFPNMQALVIEYDSTCAASAEVKGIQLCDQPPPMEEPSGP